MIKQCVWKIVTFLMETKCEGAVYAEIKNVPI